MEIPVFNVNSSDPAQMPCSAASELGLHCLSHLWDAGLKWVNVTCMLSSTLLHVVLRCQKIYS